MHILHTVLYTFPEGKEENLFKNQELYKLVIISLILVTLMFDSGVILKEKLKAGHSAHWVKELIHVPRGNNGN